MKKFFQHTGLALGYFALFQLVQFFTTMLFTFGQAIGMVCSSDLWQNAILSGFRDESAFMYFYEELANRSLEMMDVQMLLSYVIAAALFAALLYAERPASPLRNARIKLPRRPVMLWSSVLLGFGMFYAVQGGMMLIPEEAPLMQEYIEAASTLEYGKYPLLSALVTVICAPLVEELLFRGMIYRHLKKAMPTWIALIVQAAIFGVAHGQLLWMAFAMLMGLVFGLLYDYFDSLWACVIAHFCFNACNYLPFVLDLDPVGWLISMLAALLVCAVTMLLMTLYSRSRTRIEQQL